MPRRSDEGSVASLVQQREIDAEAAVGGFRAGDRLEHEVDRRALADQIERGRHMRQHAALRRNVELDPDLVQHGQQRMRAFRAVGRRVDADDGVSGAQEQAVENARRDAARIVGRMIGLQADRQAAGQAQRIAEFGDHRALRGHHHEVLQTADLAHGGGHLRRDAGRQRGQDRRRRLVRQEPVAEPADGQVGDGRKRGPVVRVDDKARDLVGLVGNDVVVQEGRQRQIGEGILRRDSLFAGLGRDAGQLVAAAQRRGLGQQRLEITESVTANSDRRTVHRQVPGWAGAKILHRSPMSA